MQKGEDRCVCGHGEKDHGRITNERYCYWSEGAGKDYRDCDCLRFAPPLRETTPQGEGQLALF